MEELQYSKDPTNPNGEGPEGIAGGGGPGPETAAGNDGRRAIRKRAVRLAQHTAKDWGSRDVSTYASSIAFYFFISMIPLLIFILQIITRMGLSQQELLDFIERLVPESSYHLASRVVYEACRYSKGTLSISALALLWAASKGTMALRCGLNKVYNEEERRPYPVLCLI